MNLVLLSFLHLFSFSILEKDSIVLHPNFRLHKKAKAVSISPDFNLQYADKHYYNTNLALVPGFEYFVKNKFSVGVKLGPEVHVRNSGNEAHYHIGTITEISVRKYFTMKLISKNTFGLLASGALHNLRWNHYHDMPTGNNARTIEAHLRPFIDIGLLFFVNSKLALQGAIRNDLRFDAESNGINFIKKPD